MDGGRPGRRARRPSWTALATLLATLVVAACSSGGSTAGPSSTKGAEATPTSALTAEQRVNRSKLSQLPAFADVPWADALKAELHAPKAVDA